jgi:hypothetical protein
MASLALALLTGCQSPGSTLGESVRTTHTLRQEPHRAAVCVARNVDEKRKSAYTARIRPGIEPVLIEVRVDAERPVSIAQLLISGDGSKAVIWVTPDPPEDRDELIAAMIEGC